jgi:hypothetical protein
MVLSNSYKTYRHPEEWLDSLEKDTIDGEEYHRDSREATDLD